MKIKSNITKKINGVDVYAMIDADKEAQACNLRSDLGNQICKERGFIAVYNGNIFRDVEGNVYIFAYKFAALQVAKEMAAKQSAA